MRNLSISLIALFQVLDFCNKFFSHPLGKARNIINECYKNILILEDHTIWHITVAEKMPGWFTCWWEGKEIVESDEQFVTSLSSWGINDSVQIYFCPIERPANSLYDRNRRNTVFHLVENLSKNEFAYCKPLTLLELEHLYRIIVKESYREGYRDGYCPPTSQ